MMSRPNQDPEKTGFNCAGCHRPDDDESEMVFCDHCQRWYHFGCAGVSTDVRDVSWSCEECLRRLADKVGPSGLDEELEKLKQEMEKEKQAMKLEKILYKKKLEHQKKLFLLRQQAEREKREMELAYEQEQMELLVAEEEAHQKKREEVLKQVQEKLEKVKRDSERMELIAQNIEKEVFECRSERGKEKRFEKELKDRKRWTSVQKGAETVKAVHEDYREAFSKFSTLKQRKAPLRQDPSSLRPFGATNSANKDPRQQKRHVIEVGESNNDPYSTNLSNMASSEDEESSEDSEEISSLDEKVRKRSKINTNRPTKAQLSARQFLSKKLPTFTGRLEEWPMFISAFETSNAACGFSNVENLARLQECLKGQALETVRSRLLRPSAVPQIIETLRMLYGRPEQLLSMLLANVRRAPSPKADQLTSYIKYGVVIQELTDHLEATGLTAHLMNPMLIQELTEKLPANLQLEWVRYRRKAQVVTLRTLSKFLSRLVKDASEIASYCEPSEENEGFHTYERKEQEDFREGFLHTHIVETNGASDQQPCRKKTACRICGRHDHRIRNCQVFKRLTLAGRWEAVRKWRLCYLCLNEHGGVPCKLNFRCNVDRCGEDHNALLHIEKNHCTNCNVHTSRDHWQRSTEESYFGY